VSEPLTAARRISEPFLKAHLALWLVKRGATSIVVSVDGAEPQPVDVPEVLAAAGHTRQSQTTRPDWTGVFQSTGAHDIRVVSRPGVDIDATLPDGRRLVGECKGEVTPTGVRSGLDRTAVYTALGQLIYTAGAHDPLPDILLLALPRTARCEGFATTLTHNPLLADWNLEVVLVNHAGTVALL